MDIYTVTLTPGAKKDLLKVPSHIIKKLHGWVDMVENDGLMATRKIPGYHDEPLKGERKGQRSIRLSKSYRAFYVEDKTGKIQLVKVLEINKHEY